MLNLAFTPIPIAWPGRRPLWEPARGPAVLAEVALPGDPPGELEVVDGAPEGGRIHDLMGDTRALSPEYAPEEMFEIASKLYKKSR